MNKHLHRLVFSRRHGMRVAVAEHAKSTGKAAGGERGAARRGLGLAVLSLALQPVLDSHAQTPAPAPAPARPPVVFASKLPAPTAPLPVIYGNTFKPDGTRLNPTLRPFAYDPARGPNSGDLREAGRVSWTVEGNKATFNQGSVDRVVLNWDSFNIGAGYQVHFAQNTDPTRYVSALNRIWSADPSLILGSLTADREVILLNANGVYFGRGSRVDTGRFVATANAVADSVFERGLRNVTDGSAVFAAAGADYLPTNLNAFISVEEGAEISSAAGGDVLLIAPRVVNQGRINTPQGQAVLAAGDKVYLMSSSDPAQRGLIVAVDPMKLESDPAVNDTSLGSVENSAQGGAMDATTGLVNRINEIRADSGTVNLVGLAVRQAGHISATTAVKGANGAIYLQAMASTVALPGGVSSPAAGRGLVVEAGARARVGAQLGTVEFTAGSVTAVTPVSGGAAQLDAEVFNPSLIRVEGQAIHVAGGAKLQAAAGKVALLAARDSTFSPLFDSGLTTLLPGDDGSRIVIAPDASISVAGLRDVAVDGARNQGSLRLFRIELADVPVQRDGPLYRSPVFFDLRDGSTIKAANVSGALASVTRTADERSTRGGSLRIEAEGAVVVGAAAALDVSGGSIRYGQTTIKNTLLDSGGRTVLFRSAAAGARLDGLLPATQQTVVPAYTEGKDGGSLTLNGRKLALAGELAGAVVQGELQRNGRAPRATAATLALGRQVGGGFYLPGVQLQARAAAALPPALFADPLQGSLADVPELADLSLPALSGAGFGALVLRAQEITQPSFGSLDLGAQGVLDLRAERNISLDGAFSASGGSITLATVRASAESASTGVGDIRLSSRTQLDTAGRWANDSAGGSGAGSDAGSAQLAGGKVNVSAAHSLFIDSGAVIDVSAGARLSAAGSLSKGTAGAVALSAGRAPASSPEFDTELSIAGVALRGYDFSAGGTLSLGVPQLTVAGQAAPGFWLAPEFFSSGGFGSIAVVANGDVRVRSGTTLAPRLQNWQLAPNYRSAASGLMDSAVASPALIDEAVAERKPVNLSLAATRTLDPQAGREGGSVVVERGAAIDLQAGGRLTLTATRNLEVGASGGTAGAASVLNAPGGQIRLGITGLRGLTFGFSPTDEPVGFLADQALWLGADARLSVAGTAQLRADDGAPALVPAFQSGGTPTAPQDRITGTVYGGGSITLEAQRGYVVADAGSVLTLDGAAASLNLPGLGSTVLVAKPAGTLKVSSPEGFVLDGTVSARAPRDSQGRALADGGVLDVSVALGGAPTLTGGNPYPGTLLDSNNQPIPGAVAKPRQLVVGDFAGLVAASGAVPGGELLTGLDNGIGYLPATLLTTAGFDALRLGAGERIRFDTSLNVNAALKISLDAPALAAKPGVQVALQAAALSLGDATSSRTDTVAPDRLASADTSPAADTTLMLRARTIDVFGNSALQGFSAATLDAGAQPGGEIRLSAVAPNVQQPGVDQASLNFAGQLTLAAGQVYTTSGSRFTFNGLAAASDADLGSRFVVRPGAGAAPLSAPLSAYGTLTVNATEIHQGGTLHQPFGAITLNAQRGLTLGEGSLTSVAADGATLLYGSTDNLSVWSTPNRNVATGLQGAKTVTLNAGTLVTAASAKVSARGGGDVQAWEFFSGVGGSSDYFLTDGLYAVLPDHAAAPALALAGGRLDPAQQARQIVITQAGSGLAPGRYTLWPARWALLTDTLPQGAYLVRRAVDQGRAVLTAPQRQDDGSVLLTGYFSEAGSATVGAPGERFVVESAPVFRAKSELRLTSISALLARNAATQGAVAPALPRDGGQVQIASAGEQSAEWRAAIDLAADGGRAGQLDVVSQRLALVDDLQKTPAGSLGLSAQVVSDSGAGSVLLGGRRRAGTAADGGATVNIDNSGTAELVVDLGSRPVQVEELILAARDQISLAAGTQITAPAVGTLGARTLLAEGDGALLAVGANALDVRRTGAQLAAGTLSVGADSVLSAPQVSLDATATLQLDRSNRFSTDALSLGARRLVVGEGAAADPLATVLSGALLSAVQAAPALDLRSYSSIDFVGLQNWSQRPAATASEPEPAPAVVRQRLVLDAPLVRGLNAADGTPARADLAAASLLLRNSSGRAAADDAGAGELVLQALPPLQYGSTGGLTVGPGAVALGFDNTSLRSGGDLVLQGSGQTSARGDLLLSAARITATQGAEQSLLAPAGTLRIATEAGSRTLGERVGQGARLTLAAQTVVQNGTLDLPGAVLAVQASGASSSEAALTFGAGSLTSVAGFTLAGPEGFDAYGRAGSISASATQGRIDVLGTLDTSAARRADGSAGDGDAGALALRATGAGGTLVLSASAADGSLQQGRLQGQAGAGATDLGGRLLVDVATLPSADALAAAAAAGGLTREFALRVRQGDVGLDQALQAQRIQLSADTGALRVGAVTLDATAPTGGVVQLAAGGDLVLAAGARIDARSRREGANGGDVLLVSSNGRVALDAAASVDARGDDTQDGRIVLRAQRGADNMSVNVNALNTAALQAAEVDVEAVRVYSTVTAAGVTRNITAIAAGNSLIAGSGNNRTGTLGQTTVRNDSAAFMTAAPALLDGLGVDATERGRVLLRAGVEVRAAADLTLSADWALQQDRPGGDAGFLSLRAAGNLTLNGSLSDGFSTATVAGVLNDNPRSWSLRLAAGADLTGANPLAVRSLGGGSVETGNLTVAAGRLVRTGAGSIDMAAGRDIRFGAGSITVPAGMAYVAGRRSAESAALLAGVLSRQPTTPTLTEQGGRLQLSAERNITSAEATQLVSNWFWRGGLLATQADQAGLYARNSQLAWWSELGRFRQTLGSFGGGDIHVAAGGDIVNLQAMAPTTGWADSRDLASASVQVRNGGDVGIMAGGSVLGGQFFAGRGVGRISAGGSIAAASTNTGLQEAALALMEGSWTLAAQRDVSTTGVFNPTAMSVPNTTAAGLRQNVSGFYYTWGAGASLALVANTGTVTLSGLDNTRVAGYGLAGDTVQYASVLAPSLYATAAGGDIALFPRGGSGALLFPAPTGQLQLWAGNDINQSSSVLAMSDAALTLWPSKARPVSFAPSQAGSITGLNGLVTTTLNDQAPRSALHQGDTEPVWVHAEASIISTGARLLLPKPARISAGEDIVSLRLSGQNLQAGDVTSVVAGRNLLATLDTSGIELAGPGALEISAGRSIDLAASAGVNTTGNQRNASLPTQGASIRLAAATEGLLDPAVLVARWLQPQAEGGSARFQQYRDALRDHVRQALKQPGLDYEQALAQFQAFPAAAQAVFGRQLLAAEFGAVYLAAAAPTEAQLTESLGVAFERRKAQVLEAGEAALAAGQALVLPGRESLQGAALGAYLADLRTLAFTSLNLDSVVPARAEQLARVQTGWREQVAAQFGRTAAALDALAASNPQDPTVAAYRAALGHFSGRGFERYRNSVLARELASTGSSASQFGRRSLPMRLALFDQGFEAAELAGAGSFVGQPVWTGNTPLFSYTGALEMTQSSVITERGGAISLLNAGGAINVGLKEIAGGASAPKGVITLGGGNIFGYAKNDFQVNTQRVFIVGEGNMDIWSSSGDIDSGRGANTAVAAPPLSPRRSADGIVFEVAATTTGSGLGILEDTFGRRAGNIGLYPAFGEILALDAFIRAPSVVLGSTIRGADNLQSAAVGGAAAVVSAPAASVAPPPANSDNKTIAAGGATPAQETRPRSSLLTVELLGLGQAPEEPNCSEEERKAGKCRKAGAP